MALEHPYFDDLDKSKVWEFRWTLAKDVMMNSNSPYFSFVNRLNPKEKDDLLEFVVNPLNSKVSIP